MVRVNLSLENATFNAISAAAANEGLSVNVFIVNLLDSIYKPQSAFDYSAAVQQLEEEAQAMALGIEFALADLPSYNDISVVRAKDAGLQPSTVRARLGKVFNAQVRNGKIAGVERATKPNGELKFYNGAALYKHVKGDENDDES